MAIAFDAASTSSKSADGSTTFDVTHTCTGSDRALCVAVVADSAADRVTGVTYNSVSMTLVDKNQATGGRWNYFYYLNAPSTGANTIRVTTDATCYRELSASSYAGVAQTGQPSVSAKSTSSSASSITGTLTTTSDNSWTVMGINGKAGTITAGSGTTRRGTTLVGAIFDSNGAITPAGSTSLIANQGASDAIAQVIVALAPASGGGGSSIVPIASNSYRLRRAA